MVRSPISEVRAETVGLPTEKSEILRVPTPEAACWSAYFLLKGTSKNRKNLV
jgi:hypothetical protein